MTVPPQRPRDPEPKGFPFTPREDGPGCEDLAQVRHGDQCVMEPGALIFHPNKVRLGHRVYIGHHAILKGYHRNELVIGDGTWIGPQCFLHSAGGLQVGRHVGIGPAVKILTSSHELHTGRTPILHAPLRFAAVHIHDGADLGTGAIVLPGVVVGEGAQVGAGAVVTNHVPPFTVVAGNPAKVLRTRCP